jgi:hypothetical protein
MKLSVVCIALILSLALSADMVMTHENTMDKTEKTVKIQGGGISGKKSDKGKGNNDADLVIF